MSVPKCTECEFGKKLCVRRNGNGASWRSGSFSQEGVYCEHEKSPREIFYGTTSPKKCPLRKKARRD